MRDFGKKLSPSELWLSGKVVRYHATPTVKDQTTGEHQWGVAMMAKILFPDAYMRIVDYLLTHDSPELVLGDWPYPAKKLMQVYEREAECEASLMEGWQPGPGFMSVEDGIIFKVCDIVELIMQTAYEIGLGNHHVRYIHQNGYNVMRDLLVKLESETQGRYRAVEIDAAVGSLVSGIIADQAERYLGPKPPKQTVTDKE